MGISTKIISACAARRRRKNGPAREIDTERRALLSRTLGWGAGLAIVGTSWSPLGARGKSTTTGADTSRAARDRARQAIPFQKIHEPLRTRLAQIVDRPTVFRRMPVQVIACDPELYTFLVRYPEVIVNMWQLMGVTKVEINRTSSFAFDAKDGAGTVSKVQLVYGTRDSHLFLADGYYEGPMVRRRVTGRCVLLLTTRFSQDNHHRPFVSSRLDVFVQLDNAGAEFIAKTLHPFFGHTADKNFAESTKFLGQVCRVAENNGPGVQRLVTRLTHVDPSIRRRFSDVTTAINQRAIMRTMLPETEPAAAHLSDHSDPPPDPESMR